MSGIKKTVNGITNEILEKVLNSFRDRIKFCSNSDGARFENTEIKSLSFPF